MSIIDQIIKENKLIKNPEEPIREEFKVLIQEKDERDNIIHYKNSDGYEYWKEYDLNNNIIHYKDSDGYEYWNEYDSNNILIKELRFMKGKYYLNDKELIKEE